jgi:hypothetical protein
MDDLSFIWPHVSDKLMAFINRVIVSIRWPHSLWRQKEMATFPSRILIFTGDLIAV